MKKEVKEKKGMMVDAVDLINEIADLYDPQRPKEYAHLVKLEKSLTGILSKVRLKLWGGVWSGPRKSWPKLLKPKERRK